jgi:Uma2 family endonuclease
MVAVAAAAASMPGLESAPEEQRMLLHDVSWKEYVILRELFDRPGLRMTYLQGALELMAPSAEHELWKKNIARFIELYAYLKNIDLYGYGSTTFKKEAKARGAEPDECYLVGKKLDDFPEIVLEVIHTAPLLNQLDVYAGMGVSEVWVFKDGRFSLYALDLAASQYIEISRSRVLPDLDFALVARYAVRPDTPQALREFERAIRG